MDAKKSTLKHEGMPSPLLPHPYNPYQPPSYSCPLPISLHYS
jgi:hypothetical protein